LRDSGWRAAWITGGATIVAAVIAGGVALANGPSPSSSDPTPAQLTQRCETAHQMGQENQRNVYPNQIKFSHCAWPPTPSAGSDGYTLIISKYGKGPGEDDTSGTNVVDRIIGPCANYTLSYSSGNKHLPPFTVRRNSIVRVDAPATPFKEPLSFPQERAETDVVRNSNYTLDDASCV
jgi:hypothetical protein